MMHSHDGGVSWSEPLRLMESAGATDYPMPLIDNKKVLIAGTQQRKDCVFFRLNELQPEAAEQVHQQATRATKSHEG